MQYLIDASVYVFRAYYSMPDDMVDDDGNPVNALYGFCRFLGDFMEQVRPDHIAVLFDESLSKSFRTEIYPEYKANRDPAPGDAALAWHRAITLVWPIAQTAMIYGALAAAIHNPALSGWEAVALMAGVGLASGGIGITFAHEMMHQKNRLERAGSGIVVSGILETA